MPFLNYVSTQHWKLLISSSLPRILINDDNKPDNVMAWILAALAHQFQHEVQVVVHILLQVFLMGYTLVS